MKPPPMTGGDCYLRGGSGPEGATRRLCLTIVPWNGQRQDIRSAFSIDFVRDGVCA